MLDGQIAVKDISSCLRAQQLTRIPPPEPRFSGSFLPVALARSGEPRGSRSRWPLLRRDVWEPDRSHLAEAGTSPQRQGTEGGDQLTPAGGVQAGAEPHPRQSSPAFVAHELTAAGLLDHTKRSPLSVEWRMWPALERVQTPGAERPLESSLRRAVPHTAKHKKLDKSTRKKRVTLSLRYRRLQSLRARPGKLRAAQRRAAMEGSMQLLSRDSHSVSHNSKRHYHDSFISMNRMRQRGVLCDIVLHVGAKEIRAHKVVLASCSPYFHAMFTSTYPPSSTTTTTTTTSSRLRDRALLCSLLPLPLHMSLEQSEDEMSESQQTHVTLHDIDPQALEQLVQYAYTAEIVVGEGNVQTLLPAASLLQLNGVRDACCKFLLSQLDPSNCLGIRGFADTHSCSDLLKSAHKYVLQHFVEVSKTEEFMLLPLKQVLDLISSDSLNVPSEEEVYRAVLSWIKHDTDGRRQHVPRLMKCVRMPLLTRDFLMSHVDTELLVRHHSECKDLLIEALKYHLMPEQRGILSNSRTRPRHCEGACPVLFAVGGGSLFAIHGDCEAYDTRTDRWHMVASMSTRRARVGVAAIGNKLYAVGGYDGTSDLATVESYEPVTNSWQVDVSMGTRRSCLGVAVLHGLLYAAGGYDGASCLNSAERYDPLTSSWTSVAAMSTRRRYVRVAPMDGCLYAVGGYDSSSHLATVEKYDPQSNGWTSIASMLSRRSSAGVAVLEGMLYVAGGNDGTSCLNSVERYNPKTNTWDGVAAMNIRRSTHDLVAMDGWLYAVGGNDGSSSLNSIEKYNPRSNKWVAASCMFTRRSSVGVAVLELLNFPPPSSPSLSVSSTSL
ncbi:hypothetical protein AAFF_G00036550 [Aldrovandia affinis]|uniref:Kelch-like protein 17 n=1 Tax=Aldrovandia affinis TaxID=143900 RepID=A0AAD7S3B3_9TELE|nr:hypothetical protein AAFF_G00036550 [Aldrovandia affinis]